MEKYMRNFRFFVAFVTMVALMSCTNIKKQVLPEFEPYHFVASDGETYNVEITYQRIANMWDREVFAKIEWQNYSNSFEGYDAERDDDGFIRMDLDAMAQRIVAEYADYVSTDDVSRCSYTMDQTAFFLRDNTILCYETLVESYAGGAHGVQTLWYECFDLESGSLYDFRYLFDGECGDAVKELIYNRLCDEYTLFVEDAAALPMSSSATLTESGVVFIYQPYEVAPYSEGIISVEISDEELSEVGAPLLWVL